MAKTTKGVRLDDELLEWFESQENGSQATREAVRLYMKLQKEFDAGIEFHLERALKLYRQYLEEVDNLQLRTNNVNSSEKIQQEEVSLSENAEESSEEVELDDLEANLDSL